MSSFSHDSERCHVRIEQTVIEARCASLPGTLGRPLFAPFCSNQGALPARWMSMPVLLAHAGHAGLAGRVAWEGA